MGNVQMRTMNIPTSKGMIPYPIAKIEDIKMIAFILRRLFER
jgi:hypothetical protein